MGFLEYGGRARSRRLIVERLEELGGPVAVVAPDESADGDVVQEAGEDDLFAGAALLHEL